MKNERINFYGKTESLVLKGLAIICMTWTHMFFYPDRYNNQISWISIGSVFNTKFELLFETLLSDAIVPIFLFCAGYAFFIGFGKETSCREDIKKLGRRICKIYKSYWIVFLIFIPICILTGCIKFDLAEFVFNFIGALSTYCGEWWFFSLYIELYVCTFLFRNFISERKRWPFIAGVSLLLMFAGYAGKFVMGQLPGEYAWIAKSWGWTELYNFLLWQTFFAMGLIFNRLDVFNRLDDFLSARFGKYKVVAYILILCGWAGAYLPGLNLVSQLVMTPCICLGVTGIVKYLPKWIVRIFEFLGKHSTYIWLCHSILLYKLMTEVVFSLRISVLCWIFLMLMSLSISIILTHAEVKITSFLKKRSNSKSQVI